MKSLSTIPLAVTSELLLLKQVSPLTLCRNYSNQVIRVESAFFSQLISKTPFFKTLMIISVVIPQKDCLQRHECSLEAKLFASICYGRIQNQKVFTKRIQILSIVKEIFSLSVDSLLTSKHLLSVCSITSHFNRIDKELPTNELN